MNDTDLIDELRDGMRAHTAHTEVPGGFADHARRTARRRSAKRVATAGAPVLVAAGVATALATGGGSGHGSQPTAAVPTPGPTITVGGGVVHDTAYIVSRVRSRVAADDGMVLHAYSPGQSGGSFSYVAPDGTQYSHKLGSQMPGGAKGVSAYFVLDPAQNGTQLYRETVVNRTDHTYDTTQQEFSVPSSGATGNSGSGAPAVGITSTAAQVQQAVQNGQVTVKGTATVDGRPAIALAVKGDDDVFTLFVDAQSYQPLRSEVTENGGRAIAPLVTDWMPATPANIALTKEGTLPAGYTRAAHNTVAAGNTGV